MIRTRGNPLSPIGLPIYVPGHGVNVVVGEPRFIGSRRGAPRHNPYDRQGPYPGTAAEIVIGLRGGAKIPGRRRYPYGTEIAEEDIERIALALREVQVGQGFGGLTIFPARGRYRSEPEETLRIVLYPQAWDWKQPERSDVAKESLSELTREGDPARFYANADQVARVLAERFEQDAVILNEVRDGRSEVSFFNWHA